MAAHTKVSDVEGNEHECKDEVMDEDPEEVDGLSALAAYAGSSDDED